MKPVSIAGIEERCRRFVKQCEEAGHKSLDIFVRKPFLRHLEAANDFRCVRGRLQG